MDNQKSSLCVSIQNVEFAKAYHYFISMSLDGTGEKRRTDISENVTNPIFSANVFVLPLDNYKLNINQNLQFQAFVVTDRNVNTSQEAQQAKLLGDCRIELGPLTSALTTISGTGAKQNVKFVRHLQDKDVTVGKMVINLKLVSDTEIPINEYESPRLKPTKNKDDYMFRGDANENKQDFQDFRWRMRVDIRSAVDLDLNQNTPTGQPSCFAEVGWTLYDTQIPDEHTLFLTNVVENDRHPMWNQQFLITNPSSVASKEGFIYVSIKDRHNVQPIDTVYIPLGPMQPFLPYNFEFFSSNQVFERRAKFYISVLLEMPNLQSFQDSLTDIIVTNIYYDPLPLANRMFLLLTLQNHTPSVVQFIEVDLKNPANIARIIADNSLENLTTFISPMQKIPPLKQGGMHQCVTYFTLPKSFLDKKLMFFVAGKNDRIESYHAMPNCVVGHTDIIDGILKKLLYSQDSRPALVPVTWEVESGLYPQFVNSTTRVELKMVSHEKLKSDNNNMGMLDTQNQNLNQNRSQQDMSNHQSAMENSNLNNQQGGKARWEVLSRELGQKQEIIHRMIKDIDDKTESLKITGSEIVDLRRHIKMLQSENAILRKRLAHEEQIEISAMVTKEISKMSVEELKAKIVKIAQAYRDERVRNEDFEKALKDAQRDIAQSSQLQVDLENLQKAHSLMSKKLLEMQGEVGKVGLYKETIRKQEKVIAKLERLMENSMKDTEKARGANLENEALKNEVINLRQQLKTITYGPNGENSDLERYKQECIKLEKIINELRDELNQKRPVTSHGDDIERDKIELEIKLKRSQARVDSLQFEMTENAKNFAREISNLKMTIAEKQALLDTLSSN